MNSRLSFLTLFIVLLSGMFALAQPPALTTSDGHKFYIIKTGYSNNETNSYELDYDYPVCSDCNILGSGYQSCNSISYQKKGVKSTLQNTIGCQFQANFLLPNVPNIVRIPCHSFDPPFYVTANYDILFRVPIASKNGVPGVQFCADETIHLESDLMTNASALLDFLAAKGYFYQWYDGFIALDEQRPFVAGQNPQIDINYGNAINSTTTKYYRLTLSNSTTNFAIKSAPIKIFPAAPSGSISQSSTYVSSESVLQGNNNISITVNHATCNGLDNATIDIGVTGSSPYKYTLSGEVDVFNKTSSTGFQFPKDAENMNLPAGLPAGDYKLTIQNVDIVTGNNTCGSDFFFTIGSPTQSTLSQNIPISNASCPDASDGKLTFAIAGGSTYSISLRNSNITNPTIYTKSGTSPLQITGLPADTYSIDYLHDANGCSVDMAAVPMSFTIIQPDPITLDAASVSYTRPLWVVQPYTNKCAASKDGQMTLNIAVGSNTNISASISDGINPPIAGSLSTPVLGFLTYTFSNVQASASPYQLTVNYGSGCSTTFTNTFTFTAPLTIPNPVVLGIPTYTKQPFNTGTDAYTNSCSGSSDGSFTIDVSNGAPDLSGGATPGYKVTMVVGGNTITATQKSINNGICTYEFTGIPIGTYTVDVVDGDGVCPSFASTPVTLTAPADTQIGQLVYSTCPSSNQSIQVTATSGYPLTGGQYSYTLLDGVNNAVSQITGVSANFQNLSPGNYKVSVEDLRGTLCPLSTATINIPAPITINMASSQPPSCIGGNDGSLSATVSGGTGPYTYSWSETAQTTASITGLAKGTYTLTVKDANNCSQTRALVLDDPAPLGVMLGGSAMATESLCFGSSRILTPSLLNSNGTQTYTYTWTSDKGLNTQAPSITVNTEGWYQVDVMSSKGCVASDRITLQYSYLPINLPATKNLCLGEQLVLDAGYAGSTYTWKDKNGVVVGTAQTLTVGTEGTYSVKVVQPSGCTGNASVVVNYGPMLIQVTPDVNEICRGSSLNINPASNGTYSWTSPNGFSSTSPQVSLKDEGIYYLKIVLPSGCNMLDDFEIKHITPPLKVTDDLATLCKGQSLNVDAGYPGATYRWSSSNGFESNRQKVSLKDAGVYYLRLVEPGGCTRYDTLEIKKVDYELKSRFTVADYAFVGDTILAVDITFPMPESVGWELWDEVTGDKVALKIVNGFMAELKFQKEGKYILRQTVTKLGCNDASQKRITIYPAKINPDGGGQAGGGTANDPLINTFSIYPNPNTGEFKAKIVLREPKDVAVSLYSDQMGTPLVLQQGSGAGEYLFDFKTPGAAKGLYFLILDVGGEQKHLRFIVY